MWSLPGHPRQIQEQAADSRPSANMQAAERIKSPTKQQNPECRFRNPRSFRQTPLRRSAAEQGLSGHCTSDGRTLKMSSRSPWTMLCCLLSAAKLHPSDPHGPSAGRLNSVTVFLSTVGRSTGRGHDRQQSDERDEGSVPEPRSRNSRCRGGSLLESSF